MWPLSLAGQAAIKSAPRYQVQVTAWRGVLKVADLAVESGSVRYSAGTGTRAVLDVVVRESPGLWELLQPGGLTLRVTYWVVFIDGTREAVPLGRFYMTKEAESGGSGLIRVNAPDLWSRVIAARFEVPSTLRGPLLAVVTRFVQDAVPGAAVAHQAATRVYVAGQVFERDRADSIKQLLDSAGLEGYFDRQGTFTTRPVPSLQGAPVWFVRDGDRGVLVSSDRERSVETVRNVQVVNPAGAYFWKPPVVVEDRDPRSPSRVSAGGTMGRIPAFYASPLIRSREQAVVVAQARLRRSTGMAASVGLSAVTNPALDPGDVFMVAVQTEGGRAGWSERHIVETTTVPFDGSPQSITTRSTIAAESGDQQEGVVVT